MRFLQPFARHRGVAGSGRAALAGACAGADLRPRHDQEHAESRMEHGTRTGVGGRGPGPGDLHENRGFSPRLRGVYRKATSYLRRQLTMSEILQPSEWARPVGYANGVAARGRMVFFPGEI